MIMAGPAFYCLSLILLLYWRSCFLCFSVLLISFSCVSFCACRSTCWWTWLGRKAHTCNSSQNPLERRCCFIWQSHCSFCTTLTSPPSLSTFTSKLKAKEKGETFGNERREYQWEIQRQRGNTIKRQRQRQRDMMLKPGTLYTNDVVGFFVGSGVI